MRGIRSTVIAFMMVAFTTGASAQVVLCLGDSLTEGYGVAREEAWPFVAERELRKKHPAIRVINAGVSGSTSASGPSRLAWQLKSKPVPEIMILALGANDGLRGQKVGALAENLRKTIAAARAGGIKKIILAGMKMPPNYGPKYTNEYDAVFPEVAKSEKVSFIPFLIDGVAGKSELNLADGIHPNAAGHRVISKTVINELEKHL